MKRTLTVAGATILLLVAASYADWPPETVGVTARAAQGIPQPLTLPVFHPSTPGDAIACTIISPPDQGTVTSRLPARAPMDSRELVYVSTNGFIGTDTFTYRATVGDLDSPIATCTVEVAANTAPESGLKRAVAASGCMKIIALRVDDAHTAVQSLHCHIVSPPAHGTAVRLLPEEYPTNSLYVGYTATNGYIGEDNFTFRASDGALTSAVATCYITVDANTAPRAGDVHATAIAHVPARMYLDIADDHSAYEELTTLIISEPHHGTLSFVESDGYAGNPGGHALAAQDVMYTATNGYVGEDAFEYAVSDGTLTSDVAICTITVGTNTSPQASDICKTVARGGEPIDISLSAYDRETQQQFLDCAIERSPSNGVLTLKYPSQAPTNSYSVIYTLTNGSGSTDSFTYTVSDGEYTSPAATGCLTIVANTAPSAWDQAVTTPVCTARDVYLGGSDVETSWTRLRFIFDQPAHGTVLYQNPETYPGNSRYVTYVPDSGYSGTDSFTFVANDGQTDSPPATVSITVKSNTAPTANDSTVDATQDMVQNIYLTVSDAETSSSALECTIVDPPEHGTATFQYPDSYPSMSRYVSYTPHPGYTGRDSLTFRASDGELESGLATCSINVEENTAPTAADMSEWTVLNTPISVRLDVDDAESSSYLLECYVESPPTHGVLEYKYPTSFPQSSYYMVYTPSNGYVGVDSFTYYCSDGALSSTVATCSLDVRENTPPVAHNVRAVTSPNTPVTLPAAFDDPDPGQSCTVSIVSNATHGVAALSGSVFTYTPNTDFVGVDRFTYIANDGLVDSTVATAFVQVREPTNRFGNLVLVIVRDALLPELTNEIARLEADLVNEGYTTKLKTFPAGTSAHVLWSYLKAEYDNTEQWLDGALLVGGLPIAKLDGSHETDLVYWNMAEHQTAGYVYDYHIWVSRLYSSGTTYGDEATLIKRALQANHDYRTGRSRLPHTAYYYHAWSSYAAGDQYGAPLTNVWPDVVNTNEVGADHQANAKFFPARTDISEGGADALVGGGEMFQETSHGNKGSYMNGRFNTTDLHRLGSQQRFVMVESCTSGDYGGIGNHHILTRLGGTVLSIGGTEINYVNDFQMADPNGNAKTVRARLAAGESWGRALIAKYPFRAQNRTAFFGDLSLGAMASASNAVPVVSGLSVSNTKPRPGEPVTFTFSLSDADAAFSDSPHCAFEHQVDWWPLGHANGKTAPSRSAIDTQPGWTNLTWTFTNAGTYVVRVEVMDEWQARGWKQLTVTVNDPPTAVDDRAYVEAGHGVAINVLTNDFDQNGHALSISRTTAPGQGAVSETDGTLVYTSTNVTWTGQDRFTYTIADGVGGSATATVRVDVVADTTAPRPTSASTEGHTNRVTLVFSEPVLPGNGAGGGENAANYRLNNCAGVTSAALQEDGDTVHLAVTGLLDYVEYILTVDNVRDRSPAANAVHPGSQVAFACTVCVAADDLESGGTAGGTGWSGAWTLGPDTSVTSDGAPAEGTYHLRLLKAGTATRTLNLSGMNYATLEFQWKANSLDAATETATVDIHDGTWHTVFTINDGEDDNAYHPAVVDLAGFSLVSNLQLRAALNANGTGDYFYLDAIRILAAGAGDGSDGDGDGMADNWELANFGRTDMSGGTPTDDQDSDGSPDSDEARLGTDPNDASSRLIVSNAVRPGAGIVLTWPSTANRRYSVLCGTNLSASLSDPVAVGLVATPPLNTHTCPATGGRGFYRVILDD